MIKAFTPDEARDFIFANSGLAIKGDTARTLYSYVATHNPRWGVIVEPQPGKDILVWYDNAELLHVIDVSNESIAKQVPKPVYSTPDESIIFNMVNQFVRLGEALPSTQTMVTLSIAAMILYAFVNLRGRTA